MIVAPTESAESADRLRLSDLAPRRKDRVMDLVREAGVDVLDWANTKRGINGARANPRYCYEWVFVEPRKVVVLNLWHAELEESDEGIVRHGNFRVDADFYERAGAKPLWRQRAHRVDQALRCAWIERTPLRVILNSGVQRVKGDVRATASKVSLRELDPMHWTLERYDEATGAFTLRRGLSARLYVDQFETMDGTGDRPSRRERIGAEFIRSRDVRLAALQRADGRCEHCGAPGFNVSDEAIHLETHHVVPLCEGGPDLLGNVIALCPNHHREAHYGQSRDDLRAIFMAVLAQR